jgi:transcriptional pleiotropic regulator of transition state genes
MKATGITRKIDDLGRIVLPKELRNTLSISQDDDIEIFVSEGKIHLRKFVPYCTFCGDAENIISYENKNICEGCIKKLGKEVTNEESESETELNKLRQVLTYKNREVNSLTEELEELKENLNKYKNNDENKIDISEYKTKINQLNNELTSNEDIIIEQQKSISIQDAELQDLKGEIGRLQHAIQEYEESVRKEKEQRVQLEKDLKILEQQSQINNLQSELKSNNETKGSFFSKLFNK